MPQGYKTSNPESKSFSAASWITLCTVYVQAFLFFLALLSESDDSSHPTVKRLLSGTTLKIQGDKFLLVSHTFKITTQNFHLLNSDNFQPDSFYDVLLPQHKNNSHLTIFHQVQISNFHLPLCINM